MALNIFFGYPTGSTLTYSVYQLATGHYYDFSNSTFEALGSVTTLTASLPEEASPFETLYSAIIPTSTTTDWTDGDYIVFVKDSASSPPFAGQAIFPLSATLSGGYDATVLPATPGQIPANFTAGTFSAPGVLAAAALVQAPSASVGTNAPAGWINSGAIAAGALSSQAVASVANLQGVSLDTGIVATAPSAATFTSSSGTLTATVSGAYLGSVILFQTTTSLGRVRRVVTGHTVAAGVHTFTIALTSGAVPSVGPSVGDTFVIE